MKVSNMPVAGQASRFALLPDDDTTDWQAPKAKGAKTKGAKADAQHAAKNGKQKSQKKQVDDLRSAAFGVGGKKNKNKAKNPTKVEAGTGSTPTPAVPPIEASPAPTEASPSPEWQKKDQQFVDDKYVSDLEKAMLESKLTFAQTTHPPPALPTPIENGSAKTKKPVALSLDQFNNMSNAQIKSMGQTGLAFPEPVVASLDSTPNIVDEAFLATLYEDAKKVLKREKQLEAIKKGPVEDLSLELQLQKDVISRYKIALTMKETTIAMLRRENEDLAANIGALRNSNRDLMTRLSQSQVRDTAELIKTLQTVEKDKADLVTEVTRLHEECEQERTKSHELAKELRKAQTHRTSSVKES
ncbi:hypothetical protein TCAL_03744 [Tigriopus californicus]|uniref:G kinase-anchoring protein 1 n=1 Tax=Tigriopus californicus TaxID=6832 RepID=A0A553NNC5_TIGCA|nr:G kinase-anchoring protein 1-like [Tigriopus californicus]TRY66952.1 hypothetical protein TCAL_03744 [Tigriopus californicus]|eukprot:TCALIF_03744-PA protein Name:"Similar to gkap1 G kinase-anchoring protein 1 (Danio rerio)" AED:0.00 eAED:0.00 QI:199/1/1/1/1/1/4/50/356